MHPNLSVLTGLDLAAYPWMRAALQEYGTQRVPGHPDANPRVLEYLKVVGLPRKGKDDDESWCSAFANWCMKQVGIRGSMGGLARGWLRWGQVLPQPVFGAITVLKRGHDPTKGHVAFYIGQQAGKLLLLGGNQSMRDKNVSLQSIVSAKEYPADRLLGHRWPVGKPVPKDRNPPRSLFPLVAR